MINQVIRDQKSWEAIDTFSFQFKDIILQEQYQHLVPKRHEDKKIDALVDVNDGFIELGFIEDNKIIDFIRFNISILKFTKKVKNNE